MFASASDDNSIRIWSQTSLECINVLNGHIKSVKSLVIVQNKYLISISKDKKVIVWDILNSFSILTTIKTAIALNSLVLFSNDSFITGDEENSIKIFNIDSLEIRIVTDLNHNSNETSSIIYYQNYLITGLFNGFIKIWKMNSFRLWHSIKAHNSTVTCLTNIYDQFIFCFSKANISTTKKKF